MCTHQTAHHGAPPGAFGPAKQYERHGSAEHERGWQEHPGAEKHHAAEGAQRAPLAPEGSIDRTPLAERLRKYVAEQGEA